MPRLVQQVRNVNRDEPGCRGCHRRHLEHEPHGGGSVADWRADMIAVLPYRELSSPLEYFIVDITHGSAPSWEQKLMRALQRAQSDPDLITKFATPGGYDIAQDRVAFFVPPNIDVALSCGVIDRYTAGFNGATCVTWKGPCEIPASLQPSIMIGRTGVAFVVSVTGRGVDDRLPVDEAAKQLTQEQEITNGI